MYTIVMDKNIPLSSQIKNIPPGATKVKFKELYREPNLKGISNALANLPPNIKMVDLSDNHLCCRSPKQLQQMTSSFPKSVHHVSLAHNQLSLMGIDLTKNFSNYESLIQEQGKAMKKMFSGFQKHIVELDLSHNDLGKLNVYSLKIGLQGLHKSFTFLNLSGNSLGQQSEVGLSEALSVLVRSESDLTVDLRNNHLFKGKSIKQHEELLRGLWPFLYKQFSNFNNNGKIILNVGKQLAYLNEINELPLDVKRLIASKLVSVSCGSNFQFNSSSFFKANPKDTIVESQSLDMLMK